MANMFEKPIAAKPMSEFAALPLAFINRLQQQKEAKSLANEASLDKVTNSFLGTHSLSGDAEEHKEIISGYQQRVDDIASNAGDDYSNVRGLVDDLRRDVSRDLRLKSINSNFNSAMKNLQENQKLLQDKKIGRAGYEQTLRNISNFKTKDDGTGAWTSYAPYTAANIVDSKAYLSDQADQIREKYSEDGQKYIAPEQVRQSLMFSMRSNPEVGRSMEENFNSMYNGPAEDRAASLAAYKQSMLESVVSDSEYRSADKAASITETGGVVGGHIIGNVALDPGGFTGHEGGSMSAIKDILRLGDDKFRAWRLGEDGANVIKHLEKTNGKMPEDYGKAVKWLEEAANKTYVGRVVTEPMTRDEVAGYMTPEGQIISAGLIKDRDGHILDAGEKAELQISNKDKSKKARIIGRLGGKTDLRGYVAFQGADNKYYFIEPTDLKTLNDPEYKMTKLTSALRSPTGNQEISLDSSLSTKDKNGNALLVQSGKYTVKADPSDRPTDKGSKDNTQRLLIYDPNGVLRYTSDVITEKTARGTSTRRYFQPYTPNKEE